MSTSQKQYNPAIVNKIIFFRKISWHVRNFGIQTFAGIVLAAILQLNFLFMTTTQEKIKRIKVDCLYGKKKHFDAADRKEKYHYWLGVPLTIITILTTTILFYVLTTGATNWVKYIPLFLAFAASFLSGFQTYFNFNKQVEGHRRVGNKYLAILKKADRLQGYITDKIISTEELIKQFETLSSNVDEINKEAEPFPTSNADYLKAKGAIESGEEEYLDKELKL